MRVSFRNLNSLLARGFSGYRITRLLPWHSSIGLLGFVIVLLVSHWFVFQLGIYMAGPILSDKEKQLKKTEASLQREQSINLALEKQYLAKITENQVLIENNKKVIALNNEIQSQFSKATYEINYLRGLVEHSNDDTTRKLSVQDFSINVFLDEKKEALYEYKIVLRLIWRGVKRAKVNYDIIISGTQDGKIDRYQLSELTGEIGETSIKYFKKISGVLKLPHGFSPQTVDVVIMPKSRKLKKITETYPWQEVFDIPATISQGSPSNASNYVKP